MSKITYKPLLNTLKSKNMLLIDIERGIGISSTTTSKFNKDEKVNLETVVRICEFLDVPIEDVVQIAKFYDGGD